jgi:L-lactate dehydrogenase complex protein LldG
MSGREQVLAKVRRALGRGGMDAGLRQDLEARLATSGPNLIPARADLDAEGRTGLFKTEAERVNADVVRVARLADAPGAVADYVPGTEKPVSVCAQPTALLKSLPWEGQAGLAVAFDPPTGDVAIGVSEAFAGVAETGTLVLRSGPDQPMRLNFLPDTHIVVLPAARIARAYEEVWASLRQEGGGAFMPRATAWVTGPSRTADIEQTLLLGAHGPRRLLIVIADEEA